MTCEVEVGQRYYFRPYETQDRVRIGRVVDIVGNKLIVADEYYCNGWNSHGLELVSKDRIISKYKHIDAKNEQAEKSFIRRLFGLS